MPSASLLERALVAEEAVERLEGRVADLESRLRGAMNADVTTASRALSWVGRAELAEDLLSEVLRYVEQRSLDTRQFPNAWISRAAAQMKSVDILRRDQAKMAERPDESEAYWETFVTPEGRRFVVEE